MASLTRRVTVRKLTPTLLLQTNGFQIPLYCLMETYEPSDIYNADETGIYYRALPDGSLTFTTDKLSGTKKIKERLTALVATNMDGTDKRPLLVIGKSKQPRCFRGLTSLPLSYTSNKNAWMTAEIFSNWLRELDREMAKKKRKIAIVIDNCAAHPKNAADDLHYVKLVFLPPNVTSLIQPCDLGIIRNLKANYRRKIVQHIVTQIYSGTDMTASTLAKTVPILDCMHMLKTAGEEVQNSSKNSLVLMMN